MIRICNFFKAKELKPLKKYLILLETDIIEENYDEYTL
jgi:hypothetical protein